MSGDELGVAAELGELLALVGQGADGPGPVIGEPKDLPDSLNVARKVAVTGIESLRDLAQAIVANGGLGCEQETLYAKVLPVLACPRPWPPT